MELKEKNNFARFYNIKSRLLFEKNTVTDPYISICIPTYKRHKETIRAIESAINQEEATYAYNVIVIDNDPDKTDTIILDYLQKIETKINIKYYKNEQNLGMFGNWNRCIELSDSNWIGLLHSDDTMDSDYLIKICRVLEKNEKRYPKPIGMIRVATRVLENGIDKSIHRGKASQIIYNRFSGKLRKFSKRDACIIGNTGFLGDTTCGSILNKEAFLQIGGFDEELYPSADALTPYLLFDKYNLFCTIDKYGTEYYGSNDSVSEKVHLGWAKQYIEFQEIMSKESKFKKLFLHFFGDEQYYCFVNEYIKNMVDLSKTEFDRTNYYQFYQPKDRPVRRSFLKLLQKTHFCLALIRTYIRG